MLSRAVVLLVLVSCAFAETSLVVSSLKVGEGMSSETVQSTFLPSEFSFVSPASTPLSCIDGRQDVQLLGMAFVLFSPKFVSMRDLAPSFLSYQVLLVQIWANGWQQ